MINIGAADRQIVLQNFTTSNTTGEAVKTWSDLATVWATVKYPTSPLSMNEGEESGVEKAIIPVEFTIRWRSDVDEKVRVYYNSQYFEVRRVNEIGRKDMLKLVTEKRV